jgi:hypothetical protein
MRPTCPAYIVSFTSDSNSISCIVSVYCTVLAVLVGLQTTPLNYSQACIADYTVGITLVLLQTVPTLTVSTVALSVDSRVPCRFPYCTVLLALSTVDSRPSTPWRLAADCRLFFFTDCFFHTLSLPRSALLKVDRCGRERGHHVPPFVYAL